MHYIVEAIYMSDYKLKLRFEDDAQKVVDLASHLDGVIFTPLRDIRYFQQFTLNTDIDTIVWPNSADFSPDFLYDIGLEAIETRESGGSQG